MLSIFKGSYHKKLIFIILGRERACSLYNEQLQAVLEQNPCQTVREISQTLGVSTATSFTPFTEHWKCKKKHKKLRIFEVCSMFCVRNTNDPCKLCSPLQLLKNKML